MPEATSSAGFLTRVERAARRSRLRAGGLSVPLLLLNVGQRFLDVRVMGLAAEMTYYAILSVFPLIGALAAGLGFLERVAGPAAVMDAEAAILASLDVVFEREVTREVFAPMVEGLLREERAGFALGSFLISLFLAGRIFRSAIHTLDVAYQVEEWRGTISIWLRGFAFSLGAILTGVVVLAMVVVGPLLGGGRAIAAWLNLDQAFEVVWALARWPAVFLVATVYFMALYAFGPNVQNRWWQTLPGALFASLGIVLVSLGFQVYLSVVGVESPAVGEAEAAVTLAAQVIGAGLAALLWFWLVSMVVLTGGVVNAEVSRLRHEMPPPEEPPPEEPPSA